MSVVPSHVTRRRALALSAAVGLGSLVRAPVAATAPRSTAPSLAAPRLTAPSSFGLDVPASAWLRGGGRSTPTMRAPRRFDLLGLRGRGLTEAGVEVRVRRAGRAWGPWTPFGAGAEHAPDRPRVAGASDPVWAGGADELQLRAHRAPRGLRVHFVAVPPTRARPRTGRAARAGGRAAQAGGPPAVIPRAQWGADAVPPRGAPQYGDVQLAFVHHTVSANDYAPEDSAGIVLAITKYHRDTNGWNDIGYNLLVDQYGQVFEGRAGGVEAAVIGAQAQGWNGHSTGIATLGSYSDVPFPEAGVAALARVLAWKLTLHGVPATGTVQVVSAGGAANRYPSGLAVDFQRISGHRDGCQTSCPGGALHAQLPQLRERAARLAGPRAVQPRLTLVPGALEIDYGAQATFAGTLLGPDGGPLAGAPVAVQKQGGVSYVTVGRATTAADGSWRVSLPWRRTGAVRAQTAVAGSPVRSAAVSIAVRTVLAVSPGPARVRAGRTVTVTGRVRPAASVRVNVERQTPGGLWVPVADVAARVRNGRFSARVRLRQPALYRLTVRSGPAARQATAAPVIVRAVRRQADVARASGGATPSTAPPAAPAGGASAG